MIFFYFCLICAFYLLRSECIDAFIFVTSYTCISKVKNLNINLMLMKLNISRYFSSKWLLFIVKAIWKYKFHASLA